MYNLAEVIFMRSRKFRFLYFLELISNFRLLYNFVTGCYVKYIAFILYPAEESDGASLITKANGIISNSVSGDFIKFGHSSRGDLRSQ